MSVASHQYKFIKNVTEAELWFDDSQATFTSLNGETAEETVSHFRGATICLLASTSTVAMYGFERFKHCFEDDPQATSSQTARRSKEQQAVFEVLQFVCWLVYCDLLWRLCAPHCGPIRWIYNTCRPVAMDLWRRKPGNWAVTITYTTLI